jgi:hypothetical protein
MKGPKRAPLLTLEALETWFDTVEPPAHCGDVSMMNGFLTGLAAGPVFLLPNDWMWYVIGDHEKRAFIGNKIQAVVDTIVDHYNLIAHQLARGSYFPVLRRTDEGEVHVGDGRTDHGDPSPLHEAADEGDDVGRVPNAVRRDHEGKLACSADGHRTDLRLLRADPVHPAAPG